MCLPLQSLQEWVYKHKIIGPIYELIGLFGPCWAFVSVMNAAVNLHYNVLLMREWWYFTISAVGCLGFALIIFLFVPAIVDPIQDQFKYQRRLSHLADKKWVAVPVFFFKFLDGFGRVWALFAATQALISMIMETDVWFTDWWFWFILSMSVLAGLIFVSAWVAKALRHGDAAAVPRSQYISDDSEIDVDDSDISGSSNTVENIISSRSYHLVKRHKVCIVPLYFFQFLNGFGRMWAFFSMINSFCAVFGVILEAYPLNWSKDVNLFYYSGWYMILSLVGSFFSGLLTLVQGRAQRKRYDALEKTLLGEPDSEPDVLTGYNGR